MVTLTNLWSIKWYLNAWIDYKKHWIVPPYEWILRSLEPFKVSPRVIGFLKHNMKKGKTQLTPTHESGTLMSDNINIKRGIWRVLHHWRILWSSYRKLSWLGFEPMTTEFCWDTLTNWAVRPWVQLALRANFVQLLQFHCLFSVRFHFSHCLRQLPHLF